MAMSCQAVVAVVATERRLPYSPLFMCVCVCVCGEQTSLTAVNDDKPFHNCTHTTQVTNDKNVRMLLVKARPEFVSGSYVIVKVLNGGAAPAKWFAHEIVVASRQNRQ